MFSMGEDRLVYRLRCAYKGVFSIQMFQMGEEGSVCVGTLYNGGCSLNI